MGKDLGAISDNLKQNLTEFFFARRWSFPPELKRARKISEAISHIRRRWPEACGITDDSERPVFIFSAGWRSGSTLVQRLVFSSREVAVWGEPLGDAALIGRLAHSLGYITSRWPPETFFACEEENVDFSNKWVANLTPEIRHLYSAHRAFFLQWCKVPVQERFGLDRWGLKEVRLTIDHARYLKWLFPHARFLFVYRNPCDAFRSWKNNKWRSAWPGYNTRSATAFARHWRLLLGGYLSGYDDVGGMLVKFEDLVSGQVDLQKIICHIGVGGFDKTVLQMKINTPTVTVKRPDITWLDRTIILNLCGGLMREVGYH